MPSVKQAPKMIEIEGPVPVPEGEDPISAVRVMKDETSRMELHIDHDVPIPVELDLEEIGPCSFLVEPVGENTGRLSTQQFRIVKERLAGLPFSKPGMNLPKKRLYTVKAIHRDGRLVQLPFEPQINNTGGGDLADAIGLRRYQRKGMIILIDWNTLIPVYCGAWGCWAAAMRESLISKYPEHRLAIGSGFCSTRHAQHTLPNTYREADAIMKGLFEQGVTTSRTWSA